PSARPDGCAGSLPPFVPRLPAAQADTYLERLRSVLDGDLIGVGYQVVVPEGVVGCSALRAHQGVLAFVLNPHEGDLPYLSGPAAAHGDDDHRETGVAQGVGLRAARALVGLPLFPHPL